MHLIEIELTRSIKPDDEKPFAMLGNEAASIDNVEMNVILKILSENAKDHVECVPVVMAFQVLDVL